MSNDERAVHQRRAIIVLLALLLAVEVVPVDGGELDAAQLTRLAAAAGAILYGMRDFLGRGKPPNDEG